MKIDNTLESHIDLGVWAFGVQALFNEDGSWIVWSTMAIMRL